MEVRVVKYPNGKFEAQHKDHFGRWKVCVFPNRTPVRYNTFEDAHNECMEYVERWKRMEEEVSAHKPEVVWKEKF